MKVKCIYTNVGHKSANASKRASSSASFSLCTAALRRLNKWVWRFRPSRVDLDKFSAFWPNTSLIKSVFMRSSSNPLPSYSISIPPSISLSLSLSLVLTPSVSECTALSVFLQWRHSFRMAPVSSMLADSCGATQLKEGLWCHQQGRGPTAWTNWIKWARARWPEAAPNSVPHSYTKRSSFF